MLLKCIKRGRTALLGSSLLAACLGGQSGPDVQDPPTAVASVAVCPCTISAVAIMVRGVVLSADACEGRVRIDAVLGGQDLDLGPIEGPILPEGDDLAPAPEDGEPTFPEDEDDPAIGGCAQP